MIRFLFALVLLILVYAMTLASFDPRDLALGALFSGAVLLLFRRFLFDRDPLPLPDVLGRIIAFPIFALAVIWDITKSTWDVALVVLHLRSLERPGIVKIPIGERTPVGVAVSALATTLSPGAFLVDVDWEEQVMLIHVLNATDPDAVRADHQRSYDRFQRRVFP